MASAKTFTDPWGWSKLDLYRECPARFKEAYIIKNRALQPSGPAIEHGNEIHSHLEHYINGWSDTLSPLVTIPHWRKRLAVLRDRRPMTEQSWGVNKKWQPLPDWFHPDTWLRAKSDFHYVDKDTLVLGDFKSGKYRIPSDDQIELYAIVGHVFYPDVKRVRTSFWFVEQDEAPHEEVYPAKKLIDLREKFNQESLKLYKEKKFGPTPGSHCRWCALSRQKGGSCKY